VKLIRWIKSDDVVRTDDELLQEAMNALGLTRRGTRIVEAITSAIKGAK
jgi:Arc/MetJ family transcription regulator